MKVKTEELAEAIRGSQSTIQWFAMNTAKRIWSRNKQLLISYEKTPNIPSHRAKLLEAAERSRDFLQSKDTDDALRCSTTLTSLIDRAKQEKLQ